MNVQRIRLAVAAGLLAMHAVGITLLGFVGWTVLCVVVAVGLGAYAVLEAQ